MSKYTIGATISITNAYMFSANANANTISADADANTISTKIGVAQCH